MTDVDKSEILSLFLAGRNIDGIVSDLGFKFSSWDIGYVIREEFSSALSLLGQTATFLPNADPNNLSLHDFLVLGKLRADIGDILKWVKG